MLLRQTPLAFDVQDRSVAITSHADTETSARQSTWHVTLENCWFTAISH